jgi:hypothetical protein
MAVLVAEEDVADHQRVDLELLVKEMLAEQVDQTTLLEAEAVQAKLGFLL